MSASQDNRITISRTRCIRLVVDMMKMQVSDTDVQEKTCKLLFEISNDDNCKFIHLANGTYQMSIGQMKRFDADLQMFILPL